MLKYINTISRWRLINRKSRNSQKAASISFTVLYSYRSWTRDKLREQLSTHLLFSKKTRLWGECLYSSSVSSSLLVSCPSAMWCSVAENGCKCWWFSSPQLSRLFSRKTRLFSRKTRFSGSLKIHKITLLNLIEKCFYYSDWLL